MRFNSAFKGLKCSSFVASSGKEKLQIIANNMKEFGCDGIRRHMAVFASGTEKTHEISFIIAGLCAEK
jgi:hypothetical protein